MEAVELSTSGGVEAKNGKVAGSGFRLMPILTTA
jgi:hypothetical protein